MDLRTDNTVTAARGQRSAQHNINQREVASLISIYFISVSLSHLLQYGGQLSVVVVFELNVAVNGCEGET